MIKEIDALGNSTSYTYSPGGKLTSVLDGMGNRNEYGYDEFGKDTYGTQGQVQPFGYTGYRYDTVAGTYFAQAREYVAGVGIFGGEDLIKGYMASPYTMNSYGYCYGNPLRFVDRDGKKPAECYDDFMAYKSLEIHKKPEILYKPGVITPTPSTSPYVGVFLLNEKGGAGTDIRDYNVFWYNCNVNAKYWLSMAGINIDPENKWYPNDSYTCTEDLILKKGKYNKWKPESGDLYDVWMKVGKNIPISKKQERCSLSE